MKNWKVRIQLIDALDGIYRQDEYEMTTSDVASNAAFDLCSIMERHEKLVKINGETPNPED